MYKPKSFFILILIFHSLIKCQTKLSLKKNFFLFRKNIPRKKSKIINLKIRMSPIRSQKLNQPKELIIDLFKIYYTTLNTTLKVEVEKKIMVSQIFQTHLHVNFSNVSLNVLS